MARYVYIIYALLRDGGWVRWSGHWLCERDAWRHIRLLHPLWSSPEGDIVNFSVRKTIAFRKRSTGLVDE